MKQGAETLAAAFTDHFVVILRLALHTSCTPHGKGYWWMNTSYLGEPTLQQTIKENWAKWQEHTKYHPNNVMCLGRNVKRMLKQLYSREGEERRRGSVEMEKFYYTAIYGVLQNTDRHAAKATTLNKLKGQILRLYITQRKGALQDTWEQDRLLGEEPSLHHFLKGRKRHEQRTVHEICGTDGILHTTSADILRISTHHMRCKYDHIPIYVESVRRITDCGLPTIPPTANVALEEPITLDE
jgi:hypothetical protein